MVKQFEDEEGYVSAVAITIIELGNLDQKSTPEKIIKDEIINSEEDPPPME